MQSQPLRAWTLGFTISHGSQVVSPKYDMDVYMATFLEVRLGTCVESQVLSRVEATVEPEEVSQLPPTWHFAFKKSPLPCFSP